MNADEVAKKLEEVRENRRAKGLYVEPTTEQIMQIWEVNLQPVAKTT